MYEGDWKEDLQILAEEIAIEKYNKEFEQLRSREKLKVIKEAEDRYTDYYSGLADMEYERQRDSNLY